jgi:hypothetical protein
MASVADAVYFSEEAHATLGRDDNASLHVGMKLAEVIDAACVF